MRKTTMSAGLAALIASGALLGGGPAFAQSGGHAFYAELSGDNELSQTGDRGAGDKNGEGAAAVVVRGRQVCFGIAVTNLGKPVAAHIHKGGAKKNGDVVVELKAPKVGTEGAVSGCTQTTASIARAIVKKPSGYYVNVHTDKFPGGAIRGQL